MASKTEHMTRLINKEFLTYTLVGCLNTAVHWLTTGLCFYGVSLPQSASNLVGFLVAVVCSFFLNAKFTFQTQTNWMRFALFTGFMAFLSWLMGYVGQQFVLPLVVTLVVFSATSLVLGYLFSKFVVFGNPS